MLWSDQGSRIRSRRSRYKYTIDVVLILIIIILIIADCLTSTGKYSMTIEDKYVIQVLRNYLGIGWEDYLWQQLIIPTNLHEFTRVTIIIRSFPHWWTITREIIRVPHIWSRNCLTFWNTRIHPRCLVMFVLLNR